MSPTRMEPGAATGSGTEFTAGAICDFGSGNRRFCLATRFSLADMFLVTTMPPPLGTDLTVALYPFVGDPLPPVRVRVLSAFIDPKDLRRTGFGALVTDMGDEAIESFRVALAACRLPEGASGDRPIFERRWYPRIEVGMDALVVGAGRRVEARVVDLSASGALLRLAVASGDAPFADGAAVQIHLYHGWTSGVVSLTAEIVRTARLQAQIGVGVRFVGLSDSVRCILDDLLLKALYLT